MNRTIFIFIIFSSLTIVSAISTMYPPHPLVQREAQEIINGREQAYSFRSPFSDDMEKFWHNPFNDYHIEKAEKTAAQDGSSCGKVWPYHDKLAKAANSLKAIGIVHGVWLSTWL